MNVARFFEHWKIIENPFLGEEARQDPVFGRIGHARGGGGSGPMPVAHPDFSKILGDLARPGSSIVFGEKGSGKTAIRLQMAERVEQHNWNVPSGAGGRVLMISFDDLNPMLDRFCATFKTRMDDEAPEVLKTLGKLRLVDHMDSILHGAVPRLIDALLGDRGGGEPPIVLPEKPWKVLRKCEPTLRRDLLLLQAIYDRQLGAPARTRSVRNKLKLPGNRSALLWQFAAYFGWLLPAGIFAADIYFKQEPFGPKPWLYATYAALGVWVFFLLKWFIFDRWGLKHTARRLRRQLRSLPRNTESLADSLALLPTILRDSAILPVDEQEEKRYAMFARFRRVLGALGYSGIIIVLDRLDEPTLVSGDPARMKAVVWPLFNNKFLQQDGIGVKLLLPIELRHELFRESSSFFQEARLDKQNLVERLSWSGPMLFDLCNARLAACRPPAAEAPPISLTDLFESDVSRQDVIDALDQMHQPRDAFKLLYQCIHDHCAAAPEESAVFRIPRLVLENVKKQQAERVSMFARGIRPA